MATSSQPSGTDKARERDADILKRLKEYRQQNNPGVKMANGAGFGTVNRLFGPAKGIKKELLRLHPSGKKACSDDLVEKAKKLNLTFRTFRDNYWYGYSRGGFTSKFVIKSGANIKASFE